MSSPALRYTTPPAETSRWVTMRRRETPFFEDRFFEAPFAVAVFAVAVPAVAAACLRRLDPVPEADFARAPLGVPAAAGEAGLGLRRLRRRFRGGGSSEPAGMSSPAMTCG